MRTLIRNSQRRTTAPAQHALRLGRSCLAVLALRLARSCLAVLLVFALAGTASVQAQEGIENDPGYVDFSELNRTFNAEPSIEINIHGALLRLVAQASEIEDPELGRLLRRIRGVYVRAFELRDVDMDDVWRYKDRLADRLDEERWDTVVRVRESDADVNFFVRLRGEEIAGIVVMSIDRYEDQTVFLNIVGDIDPEDIGRIGRKFGLNGVSDY